MKYKKIEEAIFIERPNRFIAHVKLNNSVVVVHVKNTGRCKELLIPGVKVILEESDNMIRKTRYDLVAVYKNNLLVNIDSQAPNAVVKEWLNKKGFDLVKPEYSYGKSRIDFYMKKDNIEILMEVKGCTLEKDGIGFFPDAPTERGVKHVYELIKAQKSGMKGILAFVIQMDGISEVLPNVETDPNFGIAFEEAKKAGVEVLFLKCHVEPDYIEIVD